MNNPSLRNDFHMKTVYAVCLASFFAVIMTTFAKAAEYPYMAQTATPVLKSGIVVAAGIKWNCRNSRCITTGPWPTLDVIACRELARQVGAITSFGRESRILNPEALKQCNTNAGVVKPVLPAAQTAMQKKRRAMTNSLSSDKRSATSKPFRPLAVHTVALTITGTGISAPVGAGFIPVTIQTTTLAITGTGASAPVGAGFTPVSLRTAPLALTGTGSL